MRHKKINYAKLFYSNLQLPAYTAYGNLQKITNLMVRHLNKPYFLESGGSDMLLWRCYIIKEALQFRNKVAKIILAKKNIETFNTLIGYAISFNVIFQNCSRKKRVHNMPLWFMIIARFLPFFTYSTLKIMKSCSKLTAEKQGQIWWLVAW